MLHALLLLLGLSGTVVGVSDGDTITVLDSNRQTTRVRLDGIDAPELRQAFGRRAKEFTSRLVHGKRVEVVGTKRDQYGRLIGRVIVGGQDVGLELVLAGYAWHFTRYSKDRALAEAEAAARAGRRGLWADARPTPPWEWRKGNARR